MTEKTWTILHITDLHISNPDDGDELLRNVYYDTYIGNLSKAINETLGEIQVDYIIVTGDLIDSSSDESRSRRDSNFTHADKVLRFVANQMSVDPKNMYLCLGNHDLSRTLEKSGDLTGARGAFTSLASNFGNLNSIWSSSSNRACIFRAGEDVLVLTLDSTLGANGENKSGSLDRKESEEIISAVKKWQVKGDLLIVASHHPPAVQNPIVDMLDERDPAWVNDHLWWRAACLHAELSQLSSGQVLWLSGDIHKDHHFVSRKMHTVITGRLGTRSAQISLDASKDELLKELHKTSQIARQARMIQIPSSGISKSVLFDYRFSAHQEKTLGGNWLATEVDPGKNIPETKSGFKEVQQANRLQSCDTPKALADKNKSQSKQPICIDLLSDDLQRNILGAISEDRLYSMGRFVTCKDRTSISWIPIGALLDNGELLVAVIGKMAEWIKTHFAELSPEKLGIVGIDSWGAVIASQISVMTGVRNYCVAARADGITHTESERVSKTVIKGLESCDVIILVSDVVGTGRSLQYVYKELSKGFKAREREGVKTISDKRNWAIVSVICDECCDRRRGLDFANFNVTACKDLRMPILPNKALPDKNILPPAIAFC